MVVVMLTLSFVSCGIIKGDTVMEYGDYKVTEAMYSYWASSFKAYFLYYYGNSSNYSTLWSETLPDGQTYGVFFENFLNSYAKKVLVCMKLYDEYSLSFPDETRNEIEARLDDLKKTYGGKKELNAYLSSYGLNVSTLERIYYEEAKVDIVSDYLFSSGGPKEITNTAREAYYKSNYYCVNWIYIYTEMKPEAGTDSNGNYNMVELTEVEKAEKAQLVSDIMTKLSAGESFAALKAQYCEDKNEDGTSKYDYYPNGFNISGNSYSDGYGVELIKQIQGMEIGSYSTYTDEYATRIIVRNPLVKFSELTPQEYNFMVDFESYVTEEAMEEFLASIETTFNTDVAERYKVESVKTIDMSI